MKTLDQRILIHSSPDKVWAHISNIATNARWQVDCNQVSFLTSLRKGPGVRWRATAANGREAIIETTTWYDRVGYEYTYIDGGPFKDCSGILRIQDTPDGTVIQWLLNYEPGGMFGSIRNSLRTQRKLEEWMADSLRNLWTLIKEQSLDDEDEIEDITYQSRALMQDGPDVEQRSSYKPRHTPTKEERTTTRELPIVEIPEPPLAEDDTRPRPAIASAEQLPIADENVDEPDFLPDLDLQFQRPAETDQPESSTTIEPATVSEDAIAVDDVTEIARPPEKQVEPVTATARRPERYDTLEISVFEVFGIEKPSETQQMQAVKEQESSPAPQVTSPTMTPTPQTEPHGLILTQAVRAGLRIMLRKRMIKLRRPVK